MEKVRTCHDCGKVYVGPNAGKALAGHVWLKHHKRIGIRRELEAKIEELQVALQASKSRVRVLEGELEEALTALDKEKCPECGKRLAEHEQSRDLATKQLRYYCRKGDRV
jgi:ribosomal protein S27AE